jgi:hypothetical protein
MPKFQSLKNISPAGRPTRDHSLDLLKGVACVLMLLAHTQLQIDLPSKVLTFIGSFAPILFFAVSGITANFQARKYPVAGIVATYAMIFLLGLSFAAMVAGNFWAVVVFALKSATDGLSRDLWWTGYLENVILEPGNFVVIPWLFPFFLGMFCHLAPNRHNLWLAGAALLALGIAGAAGLPLGIDNRWDMTFGYFLFSLLLTASAFYIARRLPQEFIEHVFSWLLWLGKLSLLFLYVHIGMIWVLRTYTQGILDSYLIWPVVAVASIVLMWVLPPLFGALRVPAVMSRFPAWIGLLAAILVAPLVLPAGAPLVLTELALGLVFSLYYAAMTRVLKGVEWPLGRKGAAKNLPIQGTP